MNKHLYIVYNKHTLSVCRTFEWFSACEGFCKGLADAAWINRTHPKHKEIFDKLVFPKELEHQK